MFHFTSTGEPPTNDSAMTSSQEDESAFQSNNNTVGDGGIQQKSRGTSSLSAQEDSGYEASPSSTNDNCTFSFDGRRCNSEDNSGNVADCSTLTDASPTDDAFGDSSTILMMGSHDDSDIDEEDLVIEEYEDDGEDSSTRRWAVEAASSPGTIVGSDHCRPSSLPIPIPFGDEARFRSAIDTNTRYAQRFHCHSLPLSIDVPPSPTSSPTSSTTIISPIAERLGTTFPLSWPTMRPILRAAGPVSLLSLRLAFAGSPSRQRANRSLTSRSAIPRSRRRIIDSDASSITSSEGDPAEEVFDDVESPAVDAFIPMVSSAPTANGHLVFLPDVVPHSSATGSINMNGVRRSRSVSVNLPIEDAVVEVGRTLRRLSDQFNDQIRNRHNRRYTIADIMRINRRDSDEDTSDSAQTFWRS